MTAGKPAALAYQGPYTVPLLECQFYKLLTGLPGGTKYCYFLHVVCFVEATNLSTFDRAYFNYTTYLFVSMNDTTIKITARCPIRTTLELLGGKWKLLILVQLAERPLRLSELRRRIPDISEKMLIQELKKLADSKLVARQNFGEVPPRVEYQLLAVARHVLPLIANMKAFAAQYEQQVLLGGRRKPRMQAEKKKSSFKRSKTGV